MKLCSRISLYWVSWAVCLFSIFGQTKAGYAQPIEVFVSIPPQAFLVERIGGEHVAVKILMGQSQDPHVFEPTTRQILALSRARLYLTIGLPFEKSLTEKLAAGGDMLKIVDTAVGIERLLLEEKAPGQNHAAHGRHEEDPHIWLAPAMLRKIGSNIARTLMSVDPAHEQNYQDNLQNLETEIDAADARIKEILTPYQGQTFYVYHPAFGYFGKAYGLTQVAVEMGGRNPPPKQLLSLAKAARADGVKIIFVQPQFDQKSAAVVAAAMDGAVVAIDSMARDVLENMVVMAEKIKSAIPPPAR